MSGIESCLTCAYYVDKGCSNVVNEQDGECRAHPPRLICTDKGLFSFFPAVYIEDWCGEWRAK